MKLCKHDRVLRCVECEVEKLSIKVEEMQKALEWYAENVIPGGVDMLDDCGERARQALKGDTQ